MSTENFVIARMRAGNEVNKAKARGDLPYLKGSGIICVDCKLAFAEHYDHRDYDKPIEVEPVCCSCNLLRGPAVYSGKPFNLRFPIQTAVLNVRMYPQELDAIRKAAKRAKQTIADWVRGNLMKEANGRS